MHHGEVFPHSHSATAVLSPNSFDTYTSCVDNIHASQFFEKVTITHLNDGYWSQRIHRVFYCQGTTVYTPGLDVVSFSHNFCILVKETRCTSRNINHEKINPIPVFNPLDATVIHSESYYKSLSNALSKLPVPPLVPVASPPSPTVVNAEITKLAINDNAPRTRATTPETVASNRAPSVAPSTASTVTPALPPLPPPPTYDEIPPPASPSGGTIQPVLHQDELQQRMALGRTQLIKSRSDPSPPLALPGRFPRTSLPKKPREHTNPHERMEPHEPHGPGLPPPAATTSRTSSSAEISHVPAQRPQPQFPPPAKRGKERAMAQPNLRGDGTHRPLPPRHLPTSRTRQDSQGRTQHAEPSRRPLSRVGSESSQSFYSSSKDAPDAPVSHTPVPRNDSNIFLESPPSEPLESLPEEPSANELSLNSHWKQYLRAVHEQCVVGFQSNMKLHDMMVKQFRKITAHEDHQVDLEDYSLAEIKIRLSDVENKLDQLHVVIPQNHADVSGQISRYLNRVERMFEDNEDSVSKLHNKVHNLKVKLQEHHRDNRALLEAQFNTFQDVLSRVEAQSVHVSLTLNTLEAKLVSSMEHQLQRIQTSITCNCLNSNAHTACNQAPSLDLPNACTTADL
ncbi:hypothetical protein H4Q26_010455 [Puccinia striiformis f. sp. tritici PST-130]|nr:hypothetical protein H4Q26_010455 [Puccinia striiformis f. sp. tritici PST-130]